jgi:hypothetical protein
MQWMPKSRDQKLKLDAEDQHAQTRDQIICDLMQMKAAAAYSDESLELYLRLNSSCKQLYAVKSASYTRSHHSLDQVVKQFAALTSSASILVRFASLTGNVTYLYQAMHLLLTDESQTLRGDEIWCDALDSSAAQLQIPFTVRKVTLAGDLKLPNGTV